mmetsp:Transcript_26633/g.23443  ORF Transcript_26633/g.23443 Transcript_26633/m.23443 type:complete len:134 (-) Transcript_26633:365-766(-)|eukprot:CAMPEP_0201569948 /NCGR_PEP_ID=MMETSP0190_2-20130828/11939_1 /ASSEMBLY_ACC=CAM_ASM_000263 /TAXON_ID=37353 /ORGANISM="Rosalina sp." /LENGTH=133 /DNA_ID=CAMNT_0047992921 /DNA_START=113 /DNA_END=514 /DNA_ORIENTATION=+
MAASNKLSLGSLGVGGNQAKEKEEDDAAISNSFLAATNKAFVKTAHEPKPPKDYVDSSKDVLSAEEQQKKAKQAQKKQVSVSISDANKLLPKDDDKKEQAKDDNANDDKGGAKDANANNDNQPKADDKAADDK